MDYDDDEFDIDDIEVVEILDDDEEPVPVPGISPWSTLWILADGASTLLNAADHILRNIKVDLAYRHNREVDEEDFVGSVRAGLENL